MQLLLFLLGFILFVGLVLVHEYGHYKVARRNGVGVDEFGLGIPPRAWSRRLKSGMLLSLNWLPLGGFVKLHGENDADRRKGTFGAASLGAKSRIMLAGVGMNFLTGLVILTFLALVGMPKLLTKDNVGQDQFTVASDTKIIKNKVIVSYVEPSSPAAAAGLRTQDQLVSLQAANCAGATCAKLGSSSDVHGLTTQFAGQAVKIEYQRYGKLHQATTRLRSAGEVNASKKTNNPKGYLGIVPTDLQIRRSTWSAPIVALGFTKQLTILTFKGLGQALGGLGATIAGAVTGNHQARENGQDQASAQVGGPVAIMAVLWNGGALGIYFVLMIIAIVSLTLALMNVLPIPALDGGRLFMILVSRLVLRRPLSRKVEERIVGTSMALLLSLFVLITIVDVRRFL